MKLHGFARKPFHTPLLCAYNGFTMQRRASLFSVGLPSSRGRRLYACISAIWFGAYADACASNSPNFQSVASPSDTCNRVLSHADRDLCNPNVTYQSEVRLTQHNISCWNCTKENQTVSRELELFRGLPCAIPPAYRV